MASSEDMEKLIFADTGLRCLVCLGGFDKHVENYSNGFKCVECGNKWGDINGVSEYFDFASDMSGSPFSDNGALWVTDGEKF